MNPKCFDILLIEDNPGDQRLIREMLDKARHTEFHLETVDRLSKGLEYIIQSRVDIILLDLSLPDSQGLDTFVRLHTAVKGIPIVVLSGISDETMAVQAVQVGAQDYLIKGQVDSQSLIRSLRYAMERGRLERERTQLLAQEQAARAEAEAANRTKDEFLAVVSHELRTPLNAIQGWSQMLSNGNLDPLTFKHAVESISRNAKAQTQLIEDLLDISRIVTGQLRLNIRPIEINSVIEGAADVIRPAAEAKSIQLQVVLDPQTNPVLGDPDRLQQVFWNLLSNAIKFTPQGGHIKVRLTWSKSHLEITVSDNGKGIHPEFLPYVFDRFRQADSSTTRRYGGLGLGLSIVSHLVELHGGTVQVDSPGEGQGATFTVRFPLLTSHVEINKAEQKPAPGNTTLGVMNAPSLDGVRVLLVDDEADTRKLVRAMLLQCDAEVLAVATASEALEALENWKPDVMLSDIEMPGEDGYSLLQKVRALDPKCGGGTPAAALTAYGRTEDRVRALEAGYQIHIPKPVDHMELAIVVANLAGKLKFAPRVQDMTP